MFWLSSRKNLSHSSRLVVGGADPSPAPHTPPVRFGGLCRENKPHVSSSFHAFPDEMKRMFESISHDGAHFSVNARRFARTECH